ncbi:MAG: DNA-protecting protein DprA [Gammaproteobacteria bacterium]|nr:MAG: DNA-protecting protein DprA [Gammaproteobacteria bacterium]
MEKTKAFLLLSRVPGIGARRLGVLYDYYEDVTNIIDAPREELLQVGIPEEVVNLIKRPQWDQVEKDLEWLEDESNHIVTFDDDLYPVMLREEVSAPPLLYVRGNVSLLNQRQIAMVGSRNASAYGKKVAYDFAEDFSKSGIVVTSGMALGVDAASHKGALTGRAGTIAVTATGLDRVYPARHKTLAHQIAENGALVSEFPLGTAPITENFPRRNRIISGMSAATLVVEAAKKSGSLITARYAMEQGREVFAIPGSINNPLSKGCHELIKSGAKLIETADDIICEIGSLFLVTDKKSINKLEPKLDTEYNDLLDHIGHESTSVDLLVEKTGLTPDAICSMLLILEMEGFVESEAGGVYNRIR